MDSMDRWDIKDCGFELQETSQGLVGRFVPLVRAGFPHLVMTRHWGDVQMVRDRPEGMMPDIAGALGCEEVAYLTQVHGGLALETENGGLVGQADALFTRCSGLGLVAKSADCPIVLLADPENRLVGFAHASWRSTVAGIVPLLIQRMNAAGANPSAMIACIAPSIGPDCYEVGSEVYDAAIESIGPHAATFFIPSTGRDHFDLWQANMDALTRAGVLSENIFVAQLCTACHCDLFPSYRAEGPEAGRFAVAIAMPAGH